MEHTKKKIEFKAHVPQMDNLGLLRAEDLCTLRVHSIILQSGERLPFLLGADGVPLFYPTAWLLTMRRSTGRASATLEANLYSLKLLYFWAQSHDIDIEGLFSEGKYLSPNQISSLAKEARYQLKYLQNDQHELPKTTPRMIRLTPLDKIRFGQVCNSNTATRLGTISNYLDWLSQTLAYEMGTGFTSVQQDLRAEMLMGLKSRTPKTKGRNIVGMREAPPVHEIDTLFEATKPGSDHNPFKSESIQFRNHLLLLILYALGIRIGELLGIKIGDIDFRNNNVCITRHPDDPEDPRLRQPLTKTRDRILQLNDHLTSAITRYIYQIRNKVPNATKHPFLFVSHSSGLPLSLSSVQKICSSIRENVPGSPQNLTPHQLRHAWNENFSRKCDELGVEAPREEQGRNYIMGWTPNSGSAEHYTRRHIKEKANENSLNYQTRIFSGEVK